MSERTIWKFQLLIADHTAIKMPSRAQALSVGCQGDQLYLWAIVDPEDTPVLRQFAIRGTGHPLGAAAGGRFIGTAIMRGGQLVWHVFDMEAEPNASPWRVRMQWPRLRDPGAGGPRND